MSCHNEAAQMGLPLYYQLLCFHCCKHHHSICHQPRVSNKITNTGHFSHSAMSAEWLSPLQTDSTRILCQQFLQCVVGDSIWPPWEMSCRRKFNWNTSLLQAETKKGTLFLRPSSWGVPLKNQSGLVKTARSLGWRTFLPAQTLQPRDALVCACKKRSPKPGREGEGRCTNSSRHMLDPTWGCAL